MARLGVRFIVAVILLNLLVGAVALAAEDSTRTDAMTAAAEGPTTSVPQTVGLDATHARITVRNEFDRTVTVSVGDVTQGSWVVKPGDSVDPWELTASSGTADGVSIVDNAGCGSSDGNDHFVGGHEYELVAVASENECPAGSSGPLLLIKDLTTGGTVTV